MVDELLLEEDFFRRPLRPEDLDFLEFDQPITDTNFDALCCLMTQRALLSINEADEIRLPLRASVEALKDWRSFYDPALRETAHAFRPDLEAYAFDHLNNGRALNVGADLENWLLEAERFWRNEIETLDRCGYRRDGVEFLLVQTVPLWASVPISDLIPASPEFLEADRALERTAHDLGLRTGRHSYWQFYLPGSLAIANFLRRLHRSALTLSEYAGALLTAQTERLALKLALEPADEARSRSLASKTAQHGATVREHLQSHLGSDVIAAIRAGAGQTANLVELTRAGVSDQLSWISDLSWSQTAARQIYAMIDRVAPDIDRDTFVEPREMCSTTHVHDEHRLVVIESGEMVFWGNIAMRHQMGPGDMILVPVNRLHGSTVISESCTYHQPIIPPEWRPDIPAWRDARLR